MAVLDIELLLKPVSDDAPCGRDLEYEQPFLALQELARGKPEQAIGDKIRAAQEPAWPNVRDAARDLFASTKDLRVAGILYLALVKTAGVAGLEAGLGVMRTLLERYWDQLYPLLDAEDDNDPTFRVNSLIAALVGEEVLRAQRQAALVESRQFGKHSLRGWRIATGVIKVEEGADPATDLTKIDAAFSDAPLESLSQMAALVGAAVDHLNAIQHILLDKADGIPDDLKPLSADLRDMKSLVDGHLEKRGVNIGAAPGDAAAAEGGDASGVPAQSLSGVIRNRSDVLTTIDKICDYYAKAEPSSPVPLLLQRAKRLVNKDFMEILRDLTPAGLTEAELIGGLEKRDS